MTDSPELDEFRRRIDKLASDKVLRKLVKGREVHFGKLSVDEVATLMRDDVAYYFLIAAAGLNRTTLKKATEHEDLGDHPKAAKHDRLKTGQRS